MAAHGANGKNDGGRNEGDPPIVPQSGDIVDRHGGTVARYNIYIFDREGGLIIGYHPFEVSDDAAAVAFAETFSAQRPMELWRDDFLVQSWPAEESQGIA